MCNAEKSSEYQRVLRERVKAQSELVSDEIRLRPGDDLDEYQKRLERLQAEIAVTERLLEEYVVNNDLDGDGTETEN